MFESNRPSINETAITTLIGDIERLLPKQIARKHFSYIFFIVYKLI